METTTETGMAMAEKAQVSLPSDRQVKVTRTFRAPKELVYRAHTDPALVKKWMLGPPGWSMPVCEMDVRVGGNYTWRWKSDEDGKEFGFFGTFREVDPPHCMVHAETFDPGDLGGQMGEALVTTTFTESAGVTTLTTIIEYASKDIRDAAVATGMADGMEMSYQRLDATFAASAGRA